MSWWCIFADSDKNGTITIPPERMVDYKRFETDGEMDWDAYAAEVQKVLKAVCLEVVGVEPIEVHSLPYPASPQLNKSGCPSFCYGKKECWDRSSCPRSHACDD